MLYKIHSRVVKTSRPPLEENITNVFSDVLPQGERLLKIISESEDWGGGGGGGGGTLVDLQGQTPS